MFLEIERAARHELVSRRAHKLCGTDGYHAGASDSVARHFGVSIEDIMRDREVVPE
jgi:hypothetical protein